MTRRVKVSWQEALGVDAEQEEQPPDSTPKPKPKFKPTSESKTPQPQRQKQHPNDVRTEQDLDAITGVDESSEDEPDSDVDTFGGAGFVLVELESELEELALVATEETEEGFHNVQVGKSRKENEPGSSEAKEAKKLSKKMRRRKKRLEAAEREEGAATQEKQKKNQKGKEKKKSKGEVAEEKQVQGDRTEIAESIDDTVKRSKKDKKVEVSAVRKEDAAVEGDADAPKGSKKKKRKARNADKKVERAESPISTGKDVNVGGAQKNAEKKQQKNAAGGKKSKESEEKVPTQNVVSRDRRKSRDKGSSSGSSRWNDRDNGNVTYAEYLDHDVVIKGLEMGGLLQGKLRVNSMYRMDGYIAVDGLAMDLLVKGMEDRNRALDGDLVAVRLHPESEWKPLNDDSQNRQIAAAASTPISSTAGVDQNALHSLWLPSVATDKCFFNRSPEEENSVDMLKQLMARLNERVRESRKRPTATVVFILAHGNANGFIGSLEPKTKVKDIKTPLSGNDAYAYFNAHDERLPRRIRIPRLQLPDEFISRPLLYSKTMLCFCRIKAWSTQHQSPTGEFVKTVGEFTGIETGISAILSKHGLQSHTLDFDTAVLNELDEKYGTSGEKWEVPSEELKKRKDFRNTQIFSIDPYNARDLDDALHILALNDARTKFEVGVHIADVTHFIEHNSLLDKEARSRATSVYLANRVLPMLPRILCEKLCSLQPQVDRLAFSVVWQMNLDGTLVDGVEPWFGKSIIRSCCKLDYGSAQNMLDGVITSENVDDWEEDRRPIPGANPNISNATVIQSVKDLWSVGENRRAMRFETGAVSLNDIKLVFTLDAKGNPTRYGSYELKDSNRLVEEYMLLANFLVAQQLLRAHGPLAFLRHHPPPVSRSMDRTLELLDKSDISIDGRSTKQLTESLEQLRQTRGDTTFAIVQALIIKPMKPAEYMVAGNGASPESWRHYALNIPYYTHFTSPIRRYADVVVHRLLQESVAGEENEPPQVTTDAAESTDSEARLVEFTSVAQNCNEKKMTSKNAEKECDQVFLCAYVQHHGDVEMTGVVLSMGQKSFTVYILELGLEQRLFLHDMHMTGSWNQKTSQLSIRRPPPSKKNDIAEETQGDQGDQEEKGDDDAVESNAKNTAPPGLIKLSFMKQLRMRMSATKKMPLALTFAVVGEKI